MHIYICMYIYIYIYVYMYRMIVKPHTMPLVVFNLLVPMLSWIHRGTLGVDICIYIYIYIYIYIVIVYVCVYIYIYTCTEYMYALYG